MARPPKPIDPDRSALHWLGYELRRWRTLRGNSQKALGGQIGFSRVYVSLVETAQERPARQFVERCDQALEAGGRLLAVYQHVMAEQAGTRLDVPALRAQADQPETDRTGAPRRQADDGRPAQSVESARNDAALWWSRPTGEPEQDEHFEWREATTVDHVVAPGKGEDVRRDQFLTFVGSAFASMLAPPLVHGWPDSASRMPTLTDSLLAEVRAQTEGLRWLDRKEGSRKHLSNATQHAHRAVRLWRAADDAHPLRGQLAAVAADACHLVAYQAFDQGGQGQAIDWYRCAADLAARADSQDLYAFSICGVSYMHARNADATAALAVLQQLRTLRLSAAGQCYLEVYQAHAHANARQLDLALKALGRAARVSERTEDEAPSSWLGIPDSTFVERQRAIVLAQFGVPEAIAVMERLDRTTPAVFRRYRVTLAADSALADAHAKHIEQSAHRLSSAVVLNQQTQSVERTHRIMRVLAVLEPYRSSKAVAEVHELIGDTGLRRLMTVRIPPSGQDAPAPEVR